MELFIATVFEIVLGLALGYMIGHNERPELGVNHKLFDDQRKLFIAYIISRFERTALDSDPTLPHLGSIAGNLGVGIVDIKKAQKALHMGMPDLATPIEQLLTGEVWTAGLEQNGRVQ